ncbi:hypothetical protein [Streptomyces sp. DH24]|uniref:hypothetical protein n=1 Tax=Streptomyces sp. DH24 TaxID=3040123 RepID=UPI00244216A5|nr:hypothetical protein [Streptomyces sp. DH24]MDG9717421.1 hypothetical protein [Streptomyces sp. DH24]
MSSSRHFFRSQPASQVKAEVEADLKTARAAQRDLMATGQYRMAGQMADAVDEHLDELNDLNNGTWRPKHA